MNIIYAIRFVLIVGGGAVFMATLFSICVLFFLMEFFDFPADHSDFGARELMLIFLAPSLVLSALYFKRLKMI